MTAFKEYGITQVIAVDDVFEMMIDENTMLSTLPLEIVSRQGEDFEDYVRDNPDSYLRDFFKSNDYIEQEKNDFCFEMISEDLKHYEQIQSEEVVFSGLPPHKEELMARFEIINKEDEKVLIILDKILTDATGQEKYVLGEMLGVISTLLKDNKNVFLILFSTEPEQLSSYSEVITYLVGNLGLDEEVANILALHVNFIDKDKYEIDSFISALRKSQKGNYVNSFDDIYKLSINALKDRIWDLNHNESLLHYDYLVEGQHIDDIIYHIFTDKFQSSFYKYREDDYELLVNPIRNSIQKFEKSRIDIENIDKDYAPLRYRFLKEVNLAIHTEELVRRPCKSDDISYGDIIEVDNKKYLIISQNCDITVRSNGKRNLSSYNLVEIEEMHTNIDIYWLCKYFATFCQDRRVKKNFGSERVFKGIFFDSQKETELQKIGFALNDLKEIEKFYEDRAYQKEFPDFEFENSVCFGQESVYKIVSEDIYTIPCFWLDILLLRSEDGERKIVSSDIIDSSKEIRLATKISIKNEFEEIVKRMREIPNDSLEQSFKHNLFNPIIQVEPMFNEDNLLIGFELKNVSRTKKMLDSQARSIHRNIVDNQIREASNSIIPI
ncbi:conserved hypothetical protein [Carnobacterium maltaromaticum]|uniref:hypothetical protein n=1 Tax=Carnobacterium maltaromaticum TaxID=2751 RepID=UPI00191B9F51|nr:hypothetical protein [Carnobacterium maltaromaticum]CAD5897349.1 conserved hypothetical protein [Carnobacterium maltaromaticum]